MASLSLFWPWLTRLLLDMEKCEKDVTLVSFTSSASCSLGCLRGTKVQRFFPQNLISYIRVLLYATIGWKDFCANHFSFNCVD